jgi:hypothetical protein
MTIYRDDQIHPWLLERMWIPIREFQGLDNNGTATLTLSQGTPTVEPHGTAEIVCLPMTTADEIAHFMPLPWTWKNHKKMLARIVFVHGATAADAPVFKVTSKFYARQEAITEFIAGADVTTTFAAHTCSTTNVSIEETVWTDLSWHDYAVKNDRYVGLSIELDALGGASADECRLLGLWLAWERCTQTNYRETERQYLTGNDR